jgi:hypothetical protein
MVIHPTLHLVPFSYALLTKKIPFLNHMAGLRSPLKNNLKSQIIWNPIGIKILTHNFGGPS